MAKTVGKPYDSDYPRTQAFGVNPTYYAKYGLKGHNGVDYAVPSGTNLYAGVNGVVKDVFRGTTGYGYRVTIWDPKQALLILLAHLSEIVVKTGQEVTPRTIVGRSGNTGDSTGPHVHYAVADSDVAGGRVNRGNGYDGWLDPDTTVNFGAAPGATATEPGTTQPAPGYTGPPAPPYAPSHAGQTVSHEGNNFRSDDGFTWIYQGSDAQRAAEEEARKQQEIYASNLLMTDAGVYLNKSNLTKRYAEGVHMPSNDGLRDAWRLVIKGNWKARLDPGGPNGAGATWFDKPGDYPINPSLGNANWFITSIEARPIPAPVIPPPPPDVQATITTPDVTVSATAVNLKPAVGAFPAWDQSRAPGTARLYNLVVGIANKILGQFMS